MRRLAVLLLCLLASCAQASQPTAPAPVDLHVFAASSLADVLSDLAKRYQASHADTNIVLNLAGSQQLAQQISQGAPADLFVSANQAQLDVAIASGRVRSGASMIVARNQLVVITPVELVRVQQFADLGAPGLKLVLAAPEVPAGKYSIEVLTRASADPQYGAAFKANVEANVVSYEDNVRAVLTKVALGEADAGIVYHSDAQTEQRRVAVLSIPAPFQVTASYPLAVLTDSQHPEQAQAFADFLLSDEAGQVFVAYGFLRP